MSFVECGAYVKSGDVVVVYLSHDNTTPITVKENVITQTRYGALKHNDLIGHAYGKKFSCTRGWVYILQPTPELWTMCLPHRTQILYSTDIAMITFQLELKPGSIVCESGTGSGSLSHAMIRSILPSGHLHTVEFNGERHRKAKLEFEEHGLKEYVSTYCRDVIKEGFPIENLADAVFLDLPQPDQVLAHASKALKKTGGRLCSFSPCMEQAQRMCKALNNPESGYFDIETVELVKKSHNVKRIMVPVADIGLGGDEVKNALVSSSDVFRTLPFAYEENDDIPIGNIAIRTTPDPGSNLKSHNGAKRRKTDESDGNYMKSQTPPAATKFAFSCRTCVSSKEIYGHTGYLTFASYSSKLIDYPS